MIIDNIAGDSGLGWVGCPRLNETPLLEPVVVKKIAHERLTSLVFKEECIVTACQDGYVCTWARPGRGSGGSGGSEGGQPGVLVSPTQSNQVKYSKIKKIFQKHSL